MDVSEKQHRFLRPYQYQIKATQTPHRSKQRSPPFCSLSSRWFLKISIHCDCTQWHVPHAPLQPQITDQKTPVRNGHNPSFMLPSFFFIHDEYPTAPASKETRLTSLGPANKDKKRKRQRNQEGFAFHRVHKNGVQVTVENPATNTTGKSDPERLSAVAESVTHCHWYWHNIHIIDIDR